MRPRECSECNGTLDPYLPDCPHCGAQIEADADDHYDRDIEVHRDSGGRVEEVGRRWKLHVPWGLFIILALYCAAAYGYVQYTNRTSPQTKAAQHLLIAERILGPDNGDTASTHALYVAYQNLLDALALTPGDGWGNTELEKVSWALARRGRSVPADLKRRADFLATQWDQSQSGHGTQIFESPSQRFGLGDLEDSAERLRHYIFFGGLIILLFWAYRELQEYKFLHKRDDEHELVRRDELRDLDAHRRR